ncbi:HNH endonuclease [Salmonella enterica subsp. enterica serovar Newport]|nr:HNH endonuclease [Salmonella enterica]EBN0563369.1 HNH endonuclease [Salmonella enterica subsp. enterica serovar Corvallis]EBR9096999.1 HNH endonuclease [Salmonella enterica subsp. enterica serovar Newport]EBW6451959.1 HNH endonuclease [Salmonella enterica subsp. enterica serovar Oranienburg]EBZ2217266.1 HNH endonuclease [Salmonella enterica subsp. enterica serovar Montevideo]ECD3768753.1 HNH endonuclease [Salmonella enterica subsp. enterica serovar Onderstepoort]ECI0234589.1 HNH endonucle
MALTRKQRERLRMKFGGRCAYCGCVLPEKGWHADHVQAVLRKSERCMKAAEKGIFRLKTTGEVFRPEADCPENIFPSCAPCNLLKTTYSLEMFRKQVSLQVERGCRSSVNFRTAERFGLISVVNKPVVFWFEQYEGENK